MWRVKTSRNRSRTLQSFRGKHVNQVDVNYRSARYFMCEVKSRKSVIESKEEL